MTRAPAALVCALVPALCACPGPELCDGRGGQTREAGLVLYAVGTGAGASLSGTLTVDDYTSACSYDQESFVVSLGACSLWVTLSHDPEGANRFFPGNPNAWASVASGQSCEVALVGGRAKVSITSGEIVFADSTTQLLLEGNVTAWTSGSGPTGAIQLQFEGPGWP